MCEQTILLSWYALGKTEKECEHESNEYVRKG